MDTPLLWHIPLSHYSEKLRWALDYKCIAHRRRVLGPDYLIRVWRATGQGKLPALWLDGRAIADSFVATVYHRLPLKRDRLPIATLQRPEVSFLHLIDAPKE